jgi:hypothetical protein
VTTVKRSVADLTIAEFRTMILQAIFRKSEDELVAECAAHGITFAPRNGSQPGLSRTAMMYLIEAHNIAVSAILGICKPNSMNAVSLKMCKCRCGINPSSRSALQRIAPRLEMGIQPY